MFVWQCDVFPFSLPPPVFVVVMGITIKTHHNQRRPPTLRTVTMPITTTNTDTHKHKQPQQPLNNEHATNDNHTQHTHHPSPTADTGQSPAVGPREKNQQHIIQGTDHLTHPALNRAHPPQQLPPSHQEVGYQTLCQLLGCRAWVYHRNGHSLPFRMPGICGTVVRHGQSAGPCIEGFQRHTSESRQDQGTPQVHGEDW